MYLFMLGYVAFSVYCHAGGAHKCKTQLTCVLWTALDLAAAALCIAWGVGGSKVKVIECKVHGMNSPVFESGL